MLSTLESTAIQHDSIEQNLLHLIAKICPKEEVEPIPAYSAFCDLAVNDLTITKLAGRYREQADAPTTEIDVLKGWAQKYCWKDRLKNWKPIHQAYRRKVDQQREREILQRWNDRRARFLEAADQLLAKADLMLKHPHIQKTIYEEQVAEYKGQIIPTQVVISPVKWQTGDVATLQKTALAMLEQVVGNRQIMIDRLTSDGYIISDPGAGDDDVHSYLEALEQLEELEEEIF